MSLSALPLHTRKLFWFLICKKPLLLRFLRFFIFLPSLSIKTRCLVSLCSQRLKSFSQFIYTPSKQKHNTRKSLSSRSPTHFSLPTSQSPSSPTLKISLIRLSPYLTYAHETKTKERATKKQCVNISECNTKSKEKSNQGNAKSLCIQKLGENHSVDESC